MATMTVCILHPGEMGAEVGAAARAGGARVLWVSAGRGGATRDRAGAAGLEDAGTLKAALAQSQHRAVRMPAARSARGRGERRGQRIPAAPTSTQTQCRRRPRGESAGWSKRRARPSWTAESSGRHPPNPAPPASTCPAPPQPTWLPLFAGSPLGTVVLEAPIGAASAVKACYAGWTKGAATLLLSVRALARHEGVEATLAEEWKISQPNLFAQLDRAVSQSRKGWRWIAEMEEIGATFDQAGLPDGFALAAAEVCRRLEPFRDARGTTIDAVVDALLATRAR